MGSHALLAGRAEALHPMLAFGVALASVCRVVFFIELEAGFAVSAHNDLLRPPRSISWRDCSFLDDFHFVSVGWWLYRQRTSARWQPLGRSYLDSGISGGGARCPSFWLAPHHDVAAERWFSLKWWLPVVDSLQFTRGVWNRRVYLMLENERQMSADHFRLSGPDASPVLEFFGDFKVALQPITEVA